MNHFPFLRLPNELRHKVYQAYFTLSNGYSCDALSGKLMTFDREPIDLALMYTCSLIASETNDLPLKHNVVSFFTFYHPDWRLLAGRFEYLRRAQISLQLYLLTTHGHHLTPQMWCQIREKFPWFVPNLQFTLQQGPDWLPSGNDSLLLHMDDGRWNLHRFICDVNPGIEGLRGSRYEASQAVKFCLNLLGQKLGSILLNTRSPTRTGPGRPPSRYRPTGDMKRHFHIIDFLNRCWEPWEIPTGPSIEYMGELFDDARDLDFLQRWDENTWRSTLPPKYMYRSKFRFSATAIAIRLFKRLPVTKLKAMRSVVIHEDLFAVGHQECHSHGLIPFCQDNKRLRVTIRVAMLTNILMAGSIGDSAGESLWAYREERIPFHTHDFSPRLSCWLTEALATVDAGMPAESYSLVFDGGTATGLFSCLFQEVIQRDIAFYRAVEQCFPGLLDKYDMAGLSRRFVEGMEHLLSQTSVIRCNFNPGVLLDVEGFVKKVSTDPFLPENEQEQVYSLMLLHQRLEAPAFDTSLFPQEFARWEDEMLSNWESCNLSEWRRHERARLRNNKALCRYRDKRDPPYVI
ncbi:hypothetical protein FHETE_3934 [Fusarium heterosporum]|uniref:Uncharacterized protein n=1 Tax=Fusarium heterosporum TaxID=42747 RepID=A0A8H5WQV7_FUSHE|nr:hypothetical protein FHETE_3934 [Fusarium heterosporum]